MGVPASLDYTKCIYALYTVEGEYKYIGKARYDRERLALHKMRARQERYAHLWVSQWMNEVGLENVKVCILEKIMTDDDEYAQEREMAWIKQAKEDGHELTNMTEGGRTVFNILKGEDHPRWGAKLSPEHIAAMVEGRRNAAPLIWTDEMRKAASEKSKAWHASHKVEITDEHRKKLSQGQHRRFHVNLNKPKVGCVWCEDGEAA